MTIFFKKERSSLVAKKRKEMRNVFYLAIKNKYHDCPATENDLAPWEVYSGGHRALTGQN